MPIYEYECEDCGTVSEILIRGELNHAIQCPKCGSDSLKKLITASYAIRMNGMADTSITCCGRDERCESGGSCCGQ
ncbi:zinc ribbon domain-containing protein [Chloroflexota bacterium]